MIVSNIASVTKAIDKKIDKVDTNDNSSQLNKVVESLQRGDMRKKQQNFQSQNSYPERFSF